MRPLDPLSSIKIKLGVVILAAVGVAFFVQLLGLRSGVPLVAVAISSGALALVIIQTLARGMTSPLREMVTAARAMARGDYSRRVTASSRDEVGELARAFNVMADELAEVDRMRRDLIANVSHELRTPISALQAQLENLMDGIEEPDGHSLQAMLHQVERLEGLVSQLLDLSKLESGVVPMEFRPFELAPLLQQVVQEARLAESNIDVVVEVADEINVVGDPGRIHQVIANLLANASRYSPPGGLVLIQARAEKDRVLIEVVDQGPGIPPGERTRVFERFYRTDESRSASDGGTGLGLSIARWIVDLHGGDIRAEDAIPSGCRMVVVLPAAS